MEATRVEHAFLDAVAAHPRFGRVDTVGNLWEGSVAADVRSAWIDSVALELGLPHRDSILQESPEEIAANPLRAVGETGGIHVTGPVDEIAEEPGLVDITGEVADLSIGPVEAAPQPEQASKVSMLRPVADRFGFVLREAFAPKPPTRIVPAAVEGRPLVNEFEEIRQASEPVPLEPGEIATVPPSDVIEEPVLDQSAAEQAAFESWVSEPPASEPPVFEPMVFELPDLEQQALAEPWTEEPAPVETSAEEPALAEPWLEEPAPVETSAEEPAPAEVLAEGQTLVEPWLEEPAPVETSAEEPADAAPAAELPRWWTRPAEDVVPELDATATSVEAGPVDMTLDSPDEVSEPASTEQAALPAQAVVEPVAKRRGKGACFRGVAKQFGLVHEAVEQPTVETTEPAAEILEAPVAIDWIPAPVQSIETTAEIEAAPPAPVIDEPMAAQPWFEEPPTIDEAAALEEEAKIGRESWMVREWDRV
jgi:hypothetical protein